MGLQQTSFNTLGRYRNRFHNWLRAREVLAIGKGIPDGTDAPVSH
jgi:hypothetical protein